MFDLTFVTFVQHVMATLLLIVQVVDAHLRYIAKKFRLTSYTLGNLCLIKLSKRIVLRAVTHLSLMGIICVV